MNFNYKKYFLREEVILFLLALIVRLLFLLVMLIKNGQDFSRLVLVGDAFDYHHLALNLKYLFSFSIPHVNDLPGLFLRTPGYPVFLWSIFSIFGSNPVWAMFFQALLSGFSAVLIMKIAGKIKLPRFVGFGAGILFSVEPMTAIFSNTILTETLFLFLFLLFFYFLIDLASRVEIHSKRLIFLGLIFGFATLVRPVLYPFLILVIIFLAYFLLKLKGIRLIQTVRMILLFLVGAYIFIFPWILRNKVVFNSWSVSSISDVHLYYSYAVPFYAYKHKIPNKDIAAEQLSKKLAPYVVGDKYDLRNSQVYEKFAEEIIKEDPLGYAFFHLSNTVSFFWSNGYRNIGRELGFHSSSPPINFSFMRLLLAGKIASLLDFFRNNLAYLAMFIAGVFTRTLINAFMIVGIIAGTFSERDKIKRLFILFFTATIAFFALTAGPEAYYKMRFPADPLIFILAFYGFWRVAIKLSDKFPCLRKIYT